MGIPSWPQILILLVIVLLIFGTKRVRNIGSDLGGAIREFRKGVSDDHDPAESADNGADQNGSGSTREP